MEPLLFTQQTFKQRLRALCLRAICAGAFGSYSWQALADASHWHCQPGADGQGTICQAPPAPGSTAPAASVPSASVSTAAPEAKSEPLAQPEPLASETAATTAATTQVAPQTATETTTETTTQAKTAQPAPRQQDTDSDAPYAYLDWYPLTEADPLTHCAGHYVQPAFELTDPNAPLDQQPLRIFADQSQTQGGTYSTLEGNVRVRQGDLYVTADSAEVDHTTEFTRLYGPTRYRRPGVLLISDDITLNGSEGRTIAEGNTEYVFHQSHIRGEAEKLEHVEAGSATYITNGMLTRCEPGNNGWSVNASEINLYDEEGYGVAKHATIRISDVPVMYLPVFRFPIDNRRKSGFLIPTFEYKNDGGLDIATPYYLNLAPHYDATVTPRILSERGAMMEAEFRYLADMGQFDFSAAALPDDQLAEDDRWLLGLQHNGSPAKNWSTRIDYTKVSDNDYFDDLDTGLNVTEETHLDQLAQLGYNGNSWRAGLKVQNYQTITDADTPYQKLPELTLSGNEYFAEDLYQLNYDTAFTSFDRDNTGFTGTKAINGERFVFNTSMQGNYLWPWAYVRPKLKLAHISYQLEDEPSANDDAPSLTLPVFSIDSGMYFERPSQWGDETLIHTLEPRLFYLHVPYADQSDFPDFDTSEPTFTYSQLFRDNRFSGSDRIGDTHQVTTGLTTRMLANNGAELFHASVGQIFYFEDRDVRLNPGDASLTDQESNIAAEALWNISKDLRFTADAEWDNHDMLNQRRNFKLSYASDLDHQFNVGYRFTRNDIEQLDVSGIWPINSQWSVLARWLQDYENNQTLDRILGVEYEDCCWRIRTLYRSWVDDDDTDEPENRGIFIEFTLKGLGAVGSSLTGDSGSQPNSFLQDITGFEERNNAEPAPPYQFDTYEDE